MPLEIPYVVFRFESGRVNRGSLLPPNDQTTFGENRRPGPGLELPKIRTVQTSTHRWTTMGRGGWVRFVISNHY